MGRDDWYRRTTWTADDRKAFHERLGRSRGAFHKAQYARIQASYLESAGLHDEALELLELILDEFPEKSELAMTFLQVAHCRAAKGEIPQAIEAYRASLQAERDLPSSLTQVWIEFPWFVVTSQMTRLYAEAREFLAWGREHAGSLEFPVDRYRRCAVEAFMADEADDPASAQASARAALEAARAKDSGLRYHPTVGLVKKQEAAVRRRLKRLAK